VRPSRRDGIAAKVVGMGWHGGQNICLMCSMQPGVLDQFIELRTFRRVGDFLK